jgi:hypothetical protein
LNAYENKVVEVKENTCCNNPNIEDDLINSLTICKSCGNTIDKLIMNQDHTINYEYMNDDDFQVSYIQTTNAKLRRMHIWRSTNHTADVYGERKKQLDKVVDAIYNANNNYFVKTLYKDYHAFYTSKKSKSGLIKIIYNCQDKVKEVFDNLEKYDIYEILDVIELEEIINLRNLDNYTNDQVSRLARKYKISIVNENRNRGTGIDNSLFYFIIKNDYLFNNSFEKLFELIDYLNIDVNKYNNFVKKYIVNKSDDMIIYLPKKILVQHKIFTDLIKEFDITKFILTFNKVKKKCVKVQEKIILSITLITLYPGYKNDILKTLKVSLNIFNKYFLNKSY